MHSQPNCPLFNKWFRYQCVVIKFPVCDYIYINIVNWFHTGGCPPLFVENGRAEYNTPLLHGPPPTFIRVYGVGTMASFSCDNHNITDGSGSAICQDSQTWSEQPPICNSSNENKYLILAFFITAINWYWTVCEIIWDIFSSCNQRRELLNFWMSSKLDENYCVFLSKLWAKQYTQKIWTHLWLRRKSMADTLWVVRSMLNVS